MYIKNWGNEKTIACLLQWTSHAVKQPKQNPNSYTTMWVFLTLSVLQQLDENRSTEEYNITLTVQDVRYELSFFYIK